VVIHKTKMLSSSYLGEDLLLDVLSIPFQSDHLGNQGVNHLAMTLPIVLEVLDLFGLLLGFPNEIVDHVGQLLNLNILDVNLVIQFVNHLPNTIRHITNKVNMFVQLINQMVLLMIKTSNLAIQHMDLGQELSPYGSSVLGVLLAPHLALSLFRLKEASFQQGRQ
jgi:hypothetical protein